MSNGEEATADETGQNEDSVNGPGATTAMQSNTGTDAVDTGDDSPESLVDPFSLDDDDATTDDTNQPPPAPKPNVRLSSKQRPVTVEDFVNVGMEEPIFLPDETKQRAGFYIENPHVLLTNFQGIYKRVKVLNLEGQENATKE